MPVWALPRSLAATYGIDVSFSSSGYLDVSVPRVPFHALCIGAWMARVFLAGFPHSDTCGSKDVCSSPQLFAAYHVFHRLLVPRHPPCALISLTLLYIKNIALPFIYLLSFMTALFKTNLAFSVKFLDVWLIYIYIYKLSLTVYSFQGTSALIKDLNYIIQPVI